MFVRSNSNCAAVEAGIEGREAVIDAVHEQLLAEGVEQSRSDTMQAMSGYGEFRELPMDEVSVKVRGIKGEIQQLLKLEDMQGGQAPQKTGVERREPTDEERQLIKKVNEAKKRGGYVVTDPARQREDRSWYGEDSYSQPHIRSGKGDRHTRKDRQRTHVTCS